MRASFAILVGLSLAACGTSHPITCASDAQCPAGAMCDPAQGVCLAKAGVCLPACDSSHVCDSGSVTCVAVTAPDVTVTGPAAGAFASGTLPAAAIAHAPGGVGGVRFDLSVGGTVVATAAGQASGTDPSSFAGSISLASVGDGAASLTATVTYATGSLASTPVSVTVDQTAPVIAMQTDGGTLYAATDVGTPVASITDPTSGVQDSSVSLAIAGHAAVPGTATSPGVYAFAVTIDDSVAPAGATTVVPFSISARDRAGNLATLTGAPGEVIRVDRDAPLITGVTYMPGGITDGAGHLLLGGPAGGSLTVKAAITDGAGIAMPCLRLTGETASCPHPGTNVTGNTWSFSFTKPAAPQTGTTVFDFTLEADDTLAAHLTGASKAEHQARVPQTVYFDYGPTISVAADSTPYARTTVPIPVSAFISDPAGVPDGGVFLNGSLAPSFRDGGLFTFQLNPQSAPAGVEGAYLFQISAADGLGSVSDAGATRVIDGAPPDASVQVFKDVPDGGGVTYPAAATGTGWDGTQFVYTDTVHVKGTIADVSGVASASLHIDGTDVTGAVTTGTSHPLGCTAGVNPCTFDMTIALNATGNGAFNSRTSMHQMGDINAPSAALSIVIDSTDSAHSADGTAASHSGSASLAAQTTRLLWQMYLPASVSGLGVHPNGDLIVTLDGGSDTVVALRPDDGGVHWSWGSDAGTTGAGAIDGTPAIGAGNSSAARVYVAAESGTVYALNASGAQAWHYTPAGGETFNVGPAVATATVSAASVDDVIASGALSTSSIYSLAGTTGTLLSSTAVADANNSSAPLVLSGGVYFGNASRLEMHSLSALGVLGARMTGGAAAVYQEVMTDGTSLFAWRSITSGFTSKDTALGNNWSVNVTPSGAGAVMLNSSILVPLASGAVNTFDPNPTGTGANSTLFTLGGAGHAPLIGWDGTVAHEHFYLPRDSAFTAVYDSSGNLAWQADPNGATYRAFSMDCSGRLFGATNQGGSPLLTGPGGSLVYALITDDRGLADTAWPSYRMDARNTGNVASTAGILKSGGTCTP